MLCSIHSPSAADKLRNLEEKGGERQPFEFVQRQKGEEEQEIQEWCLRTPVIN